MSSIDPELWLMAHGGLRGLEEWPDAYMWAGARAVFRFFLEGLDVFDSGKGMHMLSEEVEQQRTFREGLNAVLQYPTLDAVRTVEPEGPLSRLRTMFSDYAQQTAVSLGHDLIARTGIAEARVAAHLVALIHGSVLPAATNPAKMIVHRVLSDSLTSPVPTSHHLPGRFVKIFAEEFERSDG